MDKMFYDHLKIETQRINKQSNKTKACLYKHEHVLFMDVFTGLAVCYKIQI